MRSIQIILLTLDNFKCHQHLTLPFGGRNATLYGDNATGKTSVYDALTWLLFGKDSHGNGEKNIDIKPLDANGEVRDHQAITSVEAEFLVDGETITLKRTYQEIWATRRGSSETVYDGNTSDYYVDGVPHKKNAFDARVRELVPEDLFRMLTSVSYFAGDMKWQERRSVLFDMARTLTDREIMEKEETFHPLLDSLGKLTIPEYKAKLLSQKKGLTGVRDDAPTRINECQRTLQDMEGVDFDEARENEKQLLSKQEELSARLIGMEHDTVLDGKRLDLRSAKLERDTLESKNRAYRELQKRAGPDSSFLRNQMIGMQSRLQTLHTLIENSRTGLDRYDAEIQHNRDTWVKVNGEAFAGGVCPTCGQTLPFEQLKAATAGFEEKKRQQLRAIEATANRLKEEKDQALTRITEMEAEAVERENQIRELEEQIRQAQSTVSDASDMEDYADSIAAINAKINELQIEISRLAEDSYQVMESVRKELNDVNGQLRIVRGVIAKEAVKKSTMKRIDELKADARNAAEALESIEKMLYLIEEFTRYKAKFVETSVNDLFRVATFRLFREQANGGLEERCDVVYNGVPYMGLNNGMKINVGIDIINALSRHYGVTVPLFVDNAEGVTRLEQSEAQVIRLFVSESDKEVRVDYV